MADRISEFVISLGGDANDVRAVVSAFKSQLKSDVAEIEAATAKVELFKGAEQRAQAAQQAFFKARDAADSYRQAIAQIEGGGGKATDDLVKGLAAAEKA